MHVKLTKFLGAMFALALMAAACAPAETEQESEFTADTSAVDDVPGQPAPPPEDPEDPFYGFDLDRPVATTTEQREVLLRLRNDGLEDALVFASAGAEEVRIDSVTAGGSARVDLVTRAPVVTLRSTDLEGRLLRRVEITVGADTVSEILVSAP